MFQRWKAKYQGVYLQGVPWALSSWTSKAKSTHRAPFGWKPCSGRHLLPWSPPHSLQGLPKTAKWSHLVNTLPSHTSFSLSPCTLHFRTCHPLDLSSRRTWLCCQFCLWSVALKRKDAGIQQPKQCWQPLLFGIFNHSQRQFHYGCLQLNDL